MKRTSGQETEGPVLLVLSGLDFTYRPWSLICKTGRGVALSPLPTLQDLKGSKEDYNCKSTLKITFVFKSGCYYEDTH
jgi:hypothetical protein